MNCECFQENLYEYLDDSLPAAERTAAEKHLAQCGRCRAALQRERDLAQSLSASLERAVEPVTLEAVTQRQILQAAERALSNLPPAQPLFFRVAAPGDAVGHRRLDARGRPRIQPLFLRRQEPFPRTRKGSVETMTATCLCGSPIQRRATPSTRQPGRRRP